MCGSVSFSAGFTDSRRLSLGAGGVTRRQRMGSGAWCICGLFRQERLLPSGALHGVVARTPRHGSPAPRFRMMDISRFEAASRSGGLDSRDTSAKTSNPTAPRKLPQDDSHRHVPRSPLLEDRSRQDRHRACWVVPRSRPTTFITFLDHERPKNHSAFVSMKTGSRLASIRRP
jgi:hypothetical protein